MVKVQKGTKSFLCIENLGKYTDKIETVSCEL